MKLQIQWMADKVVMFTKEIPMMNHGDCICIGPIVPILQASDGITQKAVKTINQDIFRELTHIRYIILEDDKCDIIDWV